MNKKTEKEAIHKFTEYPKDFMDNYYILQKKFNKLLKTNLDVLLENYNQVNIIEDLKNRLKEKDKIIDEIEKLIRNGKDGKGQHYENCVRNVSIKEDKELLEILERGKNVNSK